MVLYHSGICVPYSYNKRKLKERARHSPLVQYFIKTWINNYILLKTHSQKWSGLDVRRENGSPNDCTSGVNAVPGNAFQVLPSLHQPDITPETHSQEQHWHRLWCHHDFRNLSYRHKCSTSLSHLTCSNSLHVRVYLILQLLIHVLIKYWLCPALSLFFLLLQWMVVNESSLTLLERGWCRMSPSF